MIGFALLLAACASLPPPTGEIAQAQAAVVRAGEADADQYAAPLLESARSQLLQAGDAMAAGRHERALALAQSATADADLARLQAQAQQGRAELARLQDETSRLHSQLGLPVEQAPAVTVRDAPLPAAGGDAGDPALRLQALDADPQLAPHAAMERMQARQALQTQLAARGRDARAAAAQLAARRVDIAELAARNGARAQAADQLRQTLSELQLEAARREAERMRVELERARLQEQIRAEELQRLREQADAEAQARQQAQSVLDDVGKAQSQRLDDARGRQVALARQEAELVAGATLPTSRSGADGETFVLAGDAFASGSASLQAGARAQVAAVAAYAQAMDLGRVQVVGHTDSQGEAQANLALSRRRADAVRAVLLEAGLNPGQVQASGRGAADPVADNATPAGRARNRRVHIVLAE